MPMLAGCSFIEDFDPMKSGECETGKKACPVQKKCVPLDDPATGCGNDSCGACPARANATLICARDRKPDASARSECAFKCSSGYEDCNKNPDDGCEIELGLFEGKCPKISTDSGVDSGGSGGAAEAGETGGSVGTGGSVEADGSFDADSSLPDSSIVDADSSLDVNAGGSAGSGGAIGSGGSAGSGGAIGTGGAAG